MKIERIESFILHPGTGKNLLFCRVETDDGLHGWGAPLKMQAGWVDLPTVPGLGIDIDAEQLRKRPYQQFPNRRMRHYWEEFPRKDYVTGAAH